MAVALFVVALLLLSILGVPQSPDEPTAMWRARSQDRFGLAAGPLATLEIFALSRSPLWRAVLALLTFVLISRTGEWAMRLRQERWRAAAGLAAHVGPLLLLLGLLLSAAGGWRAERLAVVPGEERLTVPGHGEVGVIERDSSLHSDRAGVRLYRQGVGPTVTASASDDANSPLGLQRSPDEPAVPQLQLLVTEEVADAYFAIPQAGLFVRIEPDPRAALDVAMPLRVQALRVPSGELVGEITATGDAFLTVAEVRISLTRGRYLLLAAVYDPGYGLKVAGLVLAALAVLAQAAWPIADASGRHLRTALGWAVGALALPTAGMALWSLTHSGLLWNGQDLQVLLTALWLAATGVWLFSHREV